MTDKKLKYLTLPTDIAHIPEARHGELIEYLKRLVTAERSERLERVLSQRTRHVTVVLENLHKAHNASAILRSCDSFGVQDLHIIDTKRQYGISNTATSGAHQWITHHFYEAENNRENLASCFASLREKGYRVYASTLREGAMPIDALPVVDHRVALLFGTELFGLTDEAHELADGWVQVPMRGFTDSLNVSVAAAICIQHTTTQIRARGVDWELGEQERASLLVQWLLNSIEQPEMVIERFIAEYQSPTG